MKHFALLFVSAALLAGCSQTPAPTGLPDAPITATPQETAQAFSDLEGLALPTTDLTPQSGSVFSVQPNGTLLANGQAHFPMGFYHVSWAGNAAKRLADLKAISAMGFNTMNVTMLDPVDDLSTFRRLLDEAASRNMRLFVEDFNDAAILALKSHPAVMGWMVADDCNNLITPAELGRRHRHVKSLDPAHLTYTSMAITYANSHDGYFGNADAVGNQSYPVDGGDSLNVVYPMMQRLVKQSTATGTLPIANLQTFKWAGGEYPTAAELNSMTNQAVAAGVKGILYYAYLDKTNDLAQYKGLNTELKKLARELKALAPVLTMGERVNVPTASNAAAHLWTYGGRRYLQVSSLHLTASQKVTVTLPRAATSLVPLFAGRPSGMTVKGTAVTGTLGAISTHWYEVR
jgi:hypothetical protein